MAFRQQACAMASERRRAQENLVPDNMSQAANRSTFEVPPEEMAFANHYFDTLDRRNMGFIPVKVLHVFFRQSGLPVEALAGIWGKVKEPGSHRGLTREEFARALCLARSKMAGDGVRPGNRFESSEGPELGLPPLTAWDRNRFSKLFFRVAPRNGILSAERATRLMQRSRLPNQQLAKIWELADDKKNGYIDQMGFVIAMYLIRSLVTWKVTSVPSSLPRAIYEAASRHEILSSTSSPGPGSIGSHGPETEPMRGGATDSAQSVLDEFFAEIRGRETSITSLLASPHSAAPSDNSERSSISADERLSWEELTNATQSVEISVDYLGHSPERSTSLEPQVASPSAISGPLPNRQAGLSCSTNLESQRPSTSQDSDRPPIPPRPTASRTWDWEVTPEDKANSDKFFDTLDPWKTGYVDGDIAGPFLAKSELPKATLAHIWHLADRDVDGRLYRDDFAVAMFLVQHAMAGDVVPSTLPVSLIPPSARSQGIERVPGSVSRSQDRLESLPPRESHQVNGQPNFSGLHASVTHDDESDRSHTPPPPYTEWVEEDL